MNPFLSPFGESMSGDAVFLIDAALKSFLLLLATLLATRLLRKRSAATIHGVWTAGFAACLAVPVVALVAPTWKLPILPTSLRGAAAFIGDAVKPRADGVTLAAATLAQKSANPAASGTHSTLLADWAAPLDARLPSSDPSAAARVDASRSTSPAPAGASRSPRAAVATVPRLSWNFALFTAWIAGTVLCLLRIAWHEITLSRMLRRCRSVSDPQWLRAVADASRTLALNRRVRLKQVDEARSPMVAGILRTVVVLPNDADAWPAARRRLVLLHELAHAKRHDVLTQTIATIACALVWFNPIGWWGLAQMRKLRELACDDMVIATGQRPADYADALLDVARTYRHLHLRLAAAIGMARGTNVENRITAILDKARSRVALSRNAVRALAAFAAALVLIIGSMRLQSHADESPTSAANTPAKAAETHSDDPKDAASAAKEQKPASKPATSADPDARTLEVRITDEAGKPLAGANLHVSIWKFDGERDYPNRDYTANDDGVIIVERPRRLTIMRMWPDMAGYVPEFVNFAEGTHEEGKLIPDRYDFQLARGTTLSGTIVDENGQPIPGVMVEVSVDVDEPSWGVNPKPMVSHWLTDDDFGDGAVITNKEGKWSITNAPSADGDKEIEFRLKHTHKDYVSDAQWGELQRAQDVTTAALRDGSARIVLDGGLALTGTVVDAAGKPVTKGLIVWSDDPYHAQGVNEAPLDDAGRLKTLTLPPGKRSITILAPGHRPERREVTIEKGMDELHFTLKPGNRLTFKVVDKDGKPIPNAYVGMGEWRGAKSIYNEKHPNVPESHVPRLADENGVYTWDWAPQDAVTYQVSAKGYSMQTATLTATDTQHVVTLFPMLVATGKVTDAATGASVPAFSVTPVIVYRPKFLTTSFDNTVSGADGRYEAPLRGGGEPHYRYQVRVEADGYRSALSEKSYGQEDGRVTQDFSLQPATAREGVVVDSSGQPVEGAAVIEATASIFPSLHEGKLDWGGRQVETTADGKFQLRATAESYRLRVMHDAGFAEIARTPDEPIGTIRLAPWASVSGQLQQDGKSVAKQTIYFNPAAEQQLGNPRYQESYYQQTDADGRFKFDRLPPVVGAVRTDLGPWEESPLTSGESAPVDLKPGEQRTVTLGGEGATITGKVIATGRGDAELDKHWSLNYLISRDRGVDLPADFPSLSFDPRQPVEASWFLDPNGSRWLTTRANYFVKLTPDGQLRINGVPPGTYDLVLRLYEQPAGCLVETIGEKVVTIEVTESDVTSGAKDLGDNEVECRAGPRIGENMGLYKFTDTSGREQSIQDMQGRYVLMHVWASWCEPCLEVLPDVQATAAQRESQPVTFVGLNVDKDASAAKELSKKRGWNWPHNYLGDSSDMARQLAISSVPTYYLIGPDGLLIASSSEWPEIKAKLEAALTKAVD